MHIIVYSRTKFADTDNERLLVLRLRVRGCSFVQFCEYFYHIFLTSENYLFICHCQPNTH